MPSHDVDRLPMYGMYTWGDAFTSRQLVALTTFSDLITEAREFIQNDALAARMVSDCNRLQASSTEARAYADAVATYLAFALDKGANLWSSICSWMSDRGALRETFARQAIPMVWDFAEANPFTQSGGSFDLFIERIADVIAKVPTSRQGTVTQLDATEVDSSPKYVICTDPPYYDNIGYADLSDFFYVWLRHSLSRVYPELFSTMLVPKSQELVASPYRFGGSREKARQFFEQGLRRTFIKMRECTHSSYPLTLYYAFKQAESNEVIDQNGNGRVIASTGWETMLQGLVGAGFAITGTWPMRTESSGRAVAHGTNALASSIVLVCRRRPEEAPVITRRDLLNTLKRELPTALKTLQHENIAPVDLAQSAIGPGMAVFSRYSKVLEADGSPMRVRTALALINQVLDEYLTEQEGEYDPETRWALAWFEQHGVDEGLYGVAETLCTAKNTAISGMEQSGILIAKAGKVRLLRRDELPQDWDPSKDTSLTVWEMTQHLIRALVDQGSEETAADLLSQLGSKAEAAHNLAYRLYTICDRKKWAQEALAYNSLVVAWPELVRLAGQQKTGSEIPRQVIMRETN